MCNIAGYVGTREATPILLEMIRVQEGINGGFYTGLAVHDGEKLHFRKLRGDLDKLLQETDARTLTGCCGMIHSRTPSGGPGLWAHPFHSEENGAVQLCYVANGGIGDFVPMNANFGIVERLDHKVRGGKAARNEALSARALAALDEVIEQAKE